MGKKEGKKKKMGFLSRNPDGPYDITVSFNRYYANGRLLLTPSEIHGFRNDDFVYFSYESTATVPDFIFQIYKYTNTQLNISIVAYDETNVGKQKYKPSSNIHPYDLKNHLRMKNRNIILGSYINSDYTKITKELIVNNTTDITNNPIILQSNVRNYKIKSVNGYNNILEIEFEKIVPNVSISNNSIIYLKSINNVQLNGFYLIQLIKDFKINVYLTNQNKNGSDYDLTNLTGTDVNVIIYKCSFLKRVSSLIPNTINESERWIKDNCTFSNITSTKINIIMNNFNLFLSNKLKYEQIQNNQINNTNVLGNYILQTITLTASDNFTFDFMGGTYLDEQLKISLDPASAFDTSIISVGDVVQITGTESTSSYDIRNYYEIANIVSNQEFYVRFNGNNEHENLGVIAFVPANSEQLIFYKKVNPRIGDIIFLYDNNAVQQTITNERGISEIILPDNSFLIIDLTASDSYSYDYSDGDLIFKLTINLDTTTFEPNTIFVGDIVQVYSTSLTNTIIGYYELENN